MSIKIYVKYVKNNRDFYTTKMNLPTGNLDSRTAIEVMGLLKSSSKTYNQTILMVTHNEALAQTCDRLIRIEDGRLYDGEREFYAKGGEMH